MRPVAGSTIRFLSAVVMRGMSNPFVVEEISSIEVAVGVPGLELISTWPCSITEKRHMQPTITGIALWERFIEVNV